MRGSRSRFPFGYARLNSLLQRDLDDPPLREIDPSNRFPTLRRYRAYRMRDISYVVSPNPGHAFLSRRFSRVRSATATRRMRPPASAKRGGLPIARLAAQLLHLGSGRGTIRIFSSAEKCRRDLCRISLTTCSAEVSPDIRKGFSFQRRSPLCNVLRVLQAFGLQCDGTSGTILEADTAQCFGAGRTGIHGT